jgi:hypothetical protein
MQRSQSRVDPERKRNNCEDERDTLQENRKNDEQNWRWKLGTQHNLLGSVLLNESAMDGKDALKSARLHETRTGHWALAPPPNIHV